MGKMEAAALILGVLMPLLAAVLHQVRWPRKVNAAIIIAACAGAGVLTAWAAGQLNWQAFTVEAVVVSVAIVIAAAQSAYQLYFRGSKLVEWIDAKTTYVELTKAE